MSGFKKLKLKIFGTLAIYFWDKVFGEDFFFDYPEVQKKIAERMFNILEL